MDETRRDIEQANERIMQSHRHSHRRDCGLDRGWTSEGNRITSYFISPSSQNMELYSTLRYMGYGDYGANVDKPYNWEVMKNNIIVEYQEGDISIREIINI